MSTSLSQKFSRLAVRLRRAFPAPQFGVLLHKTGEWAGTHTAPDYGYLRISVNKLMGPGNYEISEQRLARHVILGRISWTAVDKPKYLGAGFTLDDALRLAHTRQKEYLDRVEQGGHCWALASSSIGMAAIGQQYGLDLEQPLRSRKSLNEVKEVLA